MNTEYACHLEDMLDQSVISSSHTTCLLYHQRTLSVQCSLEANFEGKALKSSRHLIVSQAEQEMEAVRVNALTSLKRKERPITRGWGGRKFFLPRIMKDPVGRYSPLGAVLETCKRVH